MFPPAIPASSVVVFHYASITEDIRHTNKYRVRKQLPNHVKVEDTISSHRLGQNPNKVPFHISFRQNLGLSTSVWKRSVVQMKETISVYTNTTAVSLFSQYLGYENGRGKERQQDIAYMIVLRGKKKIIGLVLLSKWRGRRIISPCRSIVCIGHQSIPQTGAPALKI